MTDNHILRNHLKLKRRQLSSDTLLRHSKQVIQHLFSFEPFQKAYRIGSYMAIQGEILTHDIHKQLWQQQKQLFVPKILKDKQMIFVEYPKNALIQKNAFGISEPTNTAILSGANLEVVLVPLVAFDKHCHRLGMGAGFYDRHFQFLNHNHCDKPILIGLAHSFQAVTALDIHPFDVPLAYVITENAVIHSHT